MNCHQIRELLASSAYEELPGAEKAEADGHLASCPTCREEQTAIQETRQFLDSVPAPTVQVDIGRIYHDAARLKDWRIRRWKRLAIAVSAVAAVLLLTFLLNLEVRLQAREIVIRWGRPQTENALRQQGLALMAPETSADLQLIKELIHALAADMDRREQRQRDALVALRRELDDLQASTERYVSALHSWQIDAKGKGEEP